MKAVSEKNTRSPGSNVADLMAALIKAIVVDPCAVNVDHTDFGKLAVLSVRTAKPDFRRVVGADGRHLRALGVIASAILGRSGIEAHLVLDEENPPTFLSPNSSGPKGIHAVTALLVRVLKAIVSKPDAIEINAKAFGSSFVLGIRVAACDFAAVYGSRVEAFKYGDDGVVIGSVKNLFDAISKQSGCHLRLALIEPAK